MRHHLVKLKKPFLDMILDGRKTIESRFTKFCREPWGQIDPGDELWLKESGGPVVGYAEVEKVRAFADLTPAKVRKIISRYATGIGVGPEFAEQISYARYGLLVWLNQVRAITPFPVRGGTMQAWVVLDAPPVTVPAEQTRERSRGAIHVTVTDGMLRNGYILLGSHVDSFPADCLGERAADGRRGRPVLLELVGVGTFPTDVIAERKAFRLRGPVHRFFRFHHVCRNARLRITHVADRHYRCEPERKE